MLHESAIAPRVGTRPNVGRSPVTPFRVDGETIEPSVSEPIANGTSPAATAEPGPALDPLDPSSGFQGFLVVPPNQTSPQASAPSVSLATRTAPAASSFCTTAASSSRTWSRYGSAPHVVGAPRAARRSLAPYGMPWSGPRSMPAARSASRGAGRRERPLVRERDDGLECRVELLQAAQEQLGQLDGRHRPAPQEHAQFGDRREREVAVRRRAPHAGRRRYARALAGGGAGLPAQAEVEDERRGHAVGRLGGADGVERLEPLVHVVEHELALGRRE